MPESTLVRYGPTRQERRGWSSWVGLTTLGCFEKPTTHSLPAALALHRTDNLNSALHAVPSSPLQKCPVFIKSHVTRVLLSILLLRDKHNINNFFHKNTPQSANATMKTPYPGASTCLQQKTYPCNSHNTPMVGVKLKIKCAVQLLMWVKTELGSKAANILLSNHPSHRGKIRCWCWEYSAVPVLLVSLASLPIWMLKETQI